MVLARDKAPLAKELPSGGAGVFRLVKKGMLTLPLPLLPPRLLPWPLTPTLPHPAASSKTQPKKSGKHLRRMGTPDYTFYICSTMFYVKGALFKLPQQFAA